MTNQHILIIFQGNAKLYELVCAQWKNNEKLLLFVIKTVVDRGD